MTSNSDESVQQVQHDFQHLLGSMTGPDARAQTAYTVEFTLFRRLLALGAALLRLCFVTRAAVRPAEPVTAHDEMRLTAHDQRPMTYYAVVGKGRLWRHAFTAPGHESLGPLDAELSLPAHGHADLLREWAVYGTMDESSRESQTVLDRLLGVSLSLQAIETSVADAAGDVTALSTQPVEPRPRPTDGAILVVQADGTWVPLVQPAPVTPPVRLGKGQKRTKKQEAVVTSLYTIAPDPRTPQDVVAALLPEGERPATAARPVPVDQELRATLEGKAVAVTRVAQRASQRAGAHIQHRVALTDGAEALQEQGQTHCSQYTLVLDIIHATAYLWDTANALLGATHPHRLAWVRAYLEPLLAGQTDAVITALEAEGKDPTCTMLQRQAVRRTVGYYRRNRTHMHDDEYVARGWPIGTGVVEGACGHLVKDRMEQAGMRWTQAGAQWVLDLRAVRLNGHWDTYWQLHRPQQHQRLYGHSMLAPALAEDQALEWAA